MNLGPHILSVIGLVTLIGLFVGSPVFYLAGADTSQPVPDASAAVDDVGPGSRELALQGTGPPTFGDNPLLTPAAGAVITTPRPLFTWSEATGDVLSYSLFISSAHWGQAFTTTESVFRPPHDLPGSGVYSWTVQAFNATGVSQPVTPALTFTLEYTWRLFLPGIINMPSCPSISDQSYSTIPIDGPRADRPGPQHADLNLALRSYSETDEPKSLILYQGGTDPDAPQLTGLFEKEPAKPLSIAAVFRVNDWIWTGDYPDPGHAGDPITDWPVTLMELPVQLGTPLYIPERGPELYPGQYIVMVLYAEEHRITLNYTRNDTVANGYTVHLENICVDPNLLALYRAQTDSAGWHVTGRLPALRNNQRLGTTFVGGVRVAIRDRGAFMDPRSGKDWWVGYPTTLEIQRSHDTSLR